MPLSNIDKLYALGGCISTISFFARNFIKNRSSVGDSTDEYTTLIKWDRV
jgi:hypothetical protein